MDRQLSLVEIALVIMENMSTMEILGIRVL